MAEWFKAAVLKTAERKLRRFESYSLRHLFVFKISGLARALARIDNSASKIVKEKEREGVGFRPPRNYSQFCKTKNEAAGE